MFYFKILQNVIGIKFIKNVLFFNLFLGFTNNNLLSSHTFADEAHDLGLGHNIISVASMGNNLFVHFLLFSLM